MTKKKKSPKQQQQLTEDIPMADEDTMIITLLVLK